MRAARLMRVGLLPCAIALSAWQYGQGGNMVNLPLALKRVPYDSLKDFALMASNFVALTVHPSVTFKGTRDLTTYAKANPGKLAFGATGEGRLMHFSNETPAKEAGFKPQ